MKWRRFSFPPLMFMIRETHRGSLLLKGLPAEMGNMVDDWGEVSGAVKLHHGETPLVGVDHTLYT